MDKKTLYGHTAALITILIWGTTFISTKILLAEFDPAEILFFRFLLGLTVLTAACPKDKKITPGKKQEMTFAAAGLCGVCLYYFLENTALTFTLASNAGVIVSVSPFFTAVLSHISAKTEDKLKPRFIAGFVTAITGICLIFQSSAELKINPLGDFLALLAAFVWAVYSMLTGKISGYGYGTVLSTKRIFSYGIIFMLPFLFISDIDFNIGRYAVPKYLLNLIYLGICASALCFVTWNYAVKVLGAVRTSVYIYIVPVVTVITSAAVLKEKLTPAAAAGTALTLAGLFLSEYKGKHTQKGDKENESRK